MRRTLAALLIVLTASPALAHGTDPDTYNAIRPWYCSHSQCVSEKQRERIVYWAHEKFKKHRNAHTFVRIQFCESQGRWYLRGTHDGLYQADESFKKTYGWGPSIRQQTGMAKRGFKARGTQPWQCA